jgi:outer membrane protein assembly factor BamD
MTGANITLYSRTLNAPGPEIMRMNRRRLRLLLLAILPVALFACAGNDEQQSEVQNITEAYAKAQESIDRGNYRRGIQIFEAIQARYPFSDLARQIQLELMHAYFRSGRKEQAIEAADTFMRENPIHPRVDYALYIRGLAYYEETPGILERWFRKDVTKRPPKDVELAYSSLRQLVERFPASQYAPDAEERLIAIKNRLAAYENHVADYYLRRGAYVAALNRAKAALEQYNGATGNARSLEIMAAAYEELGMSDLAADTLRVLQANFPGES